MPALNSWPFSWGASLFLQFNQSFSFWLELLLSWYKWQNLDSTQSSLPLISQESRPSQCPSAVGIGDPPHPITEAFSGTIQAHACCLFSAPDHIYPSCRTELTVWVPKPKDRPRVIIFLFKSKNKNKTHSASPLSPRGSGRLWVLCTNPKDRGGSWVPHPL